MCRKITSLVRSLKPYLFAITEVIHLMPASRSWLQITTGTKFTSCFNRGKPDPFLSKMLALTYPLTQVSLLRRRLQIQVTATFSRTLPTRFQLTGTSLRVFLRRRSRCKTTKTLFGALKESLTRKLTQTD